MDIIIDAFKNLYRRKSRTALAVTGVAVGVFAFLIMGAMAEHFQRISLQFENLFKDRVFVCERLSFWAGGGMLSEAKIDKISDLNGIREIIPVLISRKSDNRMIVIGLPRVVVGLPADSVPLMIGRFRAQWGNLNLSDDESAILGYDVARENHISTGNFITVRKKQFKVTGILEKTGGLYDGQIMITLPSAQKLFNRKGLITSIFIIPKDGEDPEKLALKIKERIDNLEVVPPSMIKEQIRSSLSLWNSITMGAALAAAMAGALCVIITMLVSVTERVVEIGLKKAIGATTGQIMTEFISEAVIVTVSGWLLGGVMGFLFVNYVSVYLDSLGSNLFDLTLRLYIAALAGSVVLGFISGIYPAYRAATTEPAEALKVRY